MRHRGFVPSQVVSFRLPEIFSDLLSYGTLLSRFFSRKRERERGKRQLYLLSPNVYLGIFLSIEGIASRRFAHSRSGLLYFYDC